MHRSCGPVAGLVRLVDVVGDAEQTAPPRQGWQEFDVGGYDLTHCR